VDTNFGNGLISEIGGVQIGIDPNTGLPYRLPVTGQGWQESKSLNVSVLFWALGAASFGIFIAAILLRRKEGQR
jgi:hypothetical protein